ncbi:MAG: DUF6531 domain-containing protein [Agathobacter rectalis]
MTRDFSEKAKQKLEGYADDVTASSTWEKIKDWFGDRGLDFQSWTGKLCIQNYLDDVDTYHQQMLDKNNTTKQQIENIFSNVQSVDTKYMKAMNEQITCGNNIIKLIDDLAATIDPGGGNMDMKGMKGTLDADVERIKNSEATVAETIETEKFGEKAAACMNSEDPVNLSTGNFIYDHEDLQIGGEIPLSFHRYYNSKDTRVGTMGCCFLHNYEMKVEEQPDGAVGVRLHDGQIHHFEKTDSGYAAKDSALELLEKTDEGYKLIHVGRETSYFDKNGNMTRKENVNGRGITFTYDSGRRLVKAQTDTGSLLSYKYDADGRLQEVADHTGRHVLLKYERNMLHTVTTASGAVYTYSYGENGRITGVENARHVTAVKNEYDRLLRVTHQDFPDGGSMDFEYDDKKHRVILTERNGSRIIHVHDGRYRNIATLYEDGTRESFVYNDRNQCICRTDRLGHTVRMAYDNRGNLTQTADAKKRRINLTYDVNDNLTSLSINGKVRLRNHYDSKGNLTGTTDAYGNRTQIKNDAAGRTEMITYADGSIMSVVYDERGNITQLKDASGSTTAYEYDLLNRVIKTTDANHNETHFSYDELDRVKKVTDAMGHSRIYTYNAGGKIIKLNDYDGKMVSFDYNDIGKVSGYTDKEGNRTEFYYDKMWNISSVKAPDGGVQKYIYDKDNRLSEHILPMGGCVRYTYDAVGNRTSITNPTGKHTKYMYDEADRLTVIETEDGMVTKLEYDHDGNLVTETDTVGNVKNYTYDDLGRRISITENGNTTSAFYDQMGNIIRICYPNGSNTIYSYEMGCRLKSILYPNGAGEDYKYDISGRLIERKSRTGEKYIFTYDCLDRISTITNPMGGEKHFEYDALGHVTKVVDENGNNTCYEYSPNGYLINVKDALENETNYEYDCMGQLLKIRCTGTNGEKAQETSYKWDLEGNVIAVIDPMGDMETYTYDPAGRMTSKTDRDGYKTNFVYGEHGLIKEILYSDGRKVLFKYNTIRQLEEVKDWLGITRANRDERGHIKSITDPYGNMVGYEWGLMGERIATIYPNGKRVQYSYNNAMQLISLNIGNDVVNYEYDSNGRLIGKALPGGCYTGYKYDANGQLNTIIHTGMDFKETYVYEYDLSGNKIGTQKYRQGMSTDSGKYEYNYDQMNRLTEVCLDGVPQRKYSYDAFGNRQMQIRYNENGMEEKISYKYNSKNQLIEESNKGKRWNYIYDHRGNLLEVRNGTDTVKKYYFDASNRMEKVIDIDKGLTEEATYSYNGLGHRLEQNIKIAGGTDSIRYTLDMTKQYHNLLEKTSALVTEKYYWDGNVTALEEKGRKYYYFQDDLGSPMRLAGADGRSKEVYGYDEFGNDIGNDMEKESEFLKKSIQSFGFTGYQREEAGELYYAQARRYDSGVGRFVSEDYFRGSVSVPFTLNHYSYCWNRPTNFVDLNGMTPKNPTAGVSDYLYNINDVKKDKKSFSIDDYFNSANIYDPNANLLKPNGPTAGVSGQLRNINEDLINTDRWNLTNSKEFTTLKEINDENDSSDNTWVGVIGISGGIGAEVGLNLSVQYVFDGKGNVAFQWSYGTGVELGASGDVSLFGGCYDNVPNLYRLEGMGMEEGITASEVMVFGTGVWEACDEEANPLYYGKYVSIGAGATSIASGHLSVSDTKTIWSISGDNKE